MHIPNGPTKLCSECGEIKPASAFYSRSAKLVAACKECTLARITRWRKENPELVKQYGRKYSYENWRRFRLEQYGITLAEYDKMFENQKGCCAICKQPPKQKRLNVDHCHTTGKVRGLLCTKCNHGLGNFLDSTNYLTSAIQYLTSATEGSAVFPELTDYLFEELD